MRFFNKSFILITLLFLSISKAGLSQNVELIGVYDNWTAYSFVEKAGKVCYIASIPQKDEGNYTRRGDIFAIVTHRPEEKSFDVVSFVAGYTYKSGSSVEVRIGSNRFTLFTHNDTAWAKNTVTDKEIVNAMVKGVRMIVKGTSSRGTETTDTYSLVGFTNAVEAINQACNRK